MSDGPGRDAAVEVTPGAPEAPATMCWSLKDAVLSVVLAGAVDASLYDRFDLLLSGSNPRFERAAVDLEKVTFFGVAGLSLLVRLASTSGTVTLYGVSEWLPIRWAIHAAGLDRLVRYCAEDAVAATGSCGPPGCPFAATLV